MKRVLVILFILTTCQYALAKEVKLPGSTTFQKRILNPLRSELEKTTGFKIRVTGNGTAKGVRMLLSGKVNACMSSVSFDYIMGMAGMRGSNKYKDHVILTDSVVVIVNKNNPVNRLTKKELYRITRGKISNWKKVDGFDKDILVVEPSDRSVAKQVFKTKVLDDKRFSRHAVKVSDSPAKDIEIVGKKVEAIGILSKRAAENLPDTVKIIRTDKKINRTLSIITKEPPSPEIQTFINYFRSPEVQQILFPQKNIN